MKTRKKLLDNKGAALVTILIAVTFMTIMASSLMYMAYMNYLTKSMRYSSTDNFYTDEFALDELATALQQIAADATNITAARNAILTGVGETSRDGHHAYTESKVQSLIKVASQEATISVNCAYVQNGVLTKDSLYDGGTYITLYGVMITATTPEGYQSTITSDITISFPNSLPGTMDINDFSILTDSPMIFNTGGSRYYSGNMFIQALGGSPNVALKVDNHTVVGLLSPQAMIVGDVVVDNGSILHVTGSLVVYGSITVQNGSTLICSGELTHSGAITNNGGTIKGISAGDYAAQTVEMSDQLDVENGLVASLFRNVRVWGRSVDGGDTAPYKWLDYSLEMYGANASNNFMLKGHSSGVQTHIFGQDQTINTGYSYENALILSTKDIRYNVSMTFPNTTIMTTGTISYLTSQGTSYMSKMSDEAFEIAKSYLFCPPETQLNPFDGSGNPNTRVYFPKHNDNTAYTTEDYDLSTFSNENKTTDDGRTFAHDDENYNYLPISYFLAEDTSNIISNIFAAPTGTANPRNSVIIYELWSKD